MKWHVGDVAIAQNCMIATHLNGQECEVLGPSGRSGEYAYNVVVFGCPSSHSTGTWSFADRHLKPLPDGNQASTWEDCVFKPKELVTYEQV